MINESLRETLGKIRFGDPHIIRGLGMLPVFYDGNGVGFQYISLSKAYKQKTIVITEINQSGSVPNLKVINKGDQPVLIIDGEELIGAKQNRIANTTVLVKEHSEIIIPVSCTEAGRWSGGISFTVADYVMPSKIRAKKTHAVAKSLSLGGSFTANQSEVWDEVDCLLDEYDVKSKTSAMEDIYNAKKEEFSEFLRNFPCEENQRGLICIYKGKVLGFDYLSLPSEYSDLHDKLIKSYAIDVLYEETTSDTASADFDPKEFIEKLYSLKESQFQSLGYGTDYRYENGGIIGSALIHENQVIHMAFFNIEENNKGKDDYTHRIFRTSWGWPRRSTPRGMFEW